jgi:hypothetical protein
MKKWSFKSDKDFEEISNKLKSTFGAAKGFVIEIKSDNSITSFKIRKRILYGWYMAFHNWTLVKVKLMKLNDKNKTCIVIVFKQHFLIKIILYTYVILGIIFFIRIIFEINNTTAKSILGGLLLVFGILIWNAIQKKFKRDIKKFKMLISEILH